MNRTHYQHVSSKKDALDVTDGEIQKEHFRDPDGSGEPSSLPHTRALALLSVSLATRPSGRPHGGERGFARKSTPDSRQALARKSVRASAARVRSQGGWT